MKILLHDTKQPNNCTPSLQAKIPSLVYNSRQIKDDDTSIVLIANPIISPNE